jgi:hypothetical protein
MHKNILASLTIFVALIGIARGQAHDFPASECKVSKVRTLNAFASETTIKRLPLERGDASIKSNKGTIKFFFTKWSINYTFHEFQNTGLGALHLSNARDRDQTHKLSIRKDGFNLITIDDKYSFIQKHECRFINDKQMKGTINIQNLESLLRNQ